jgi:hypothetical protein
LDTKSPKHLEMAQRHISLSYIYVYIYIYACVLCTYMPLCVSNEELSGYYVMCMWYGALRHLPLQLSYQEMRLVKTTPQLLG